MDDGQHRTHPTGAPGPSVGQTSHHRPGAYVGNKSGGETNMNVPATSIDADISTTRKSGGDGPNLSHDSHRADDRR